MTSAILRSGDEVAEHGALRIERLGLDVGLLHAFTQARVIILTGELDANQGRSEFAVVLLHILEMRNVITRSKHFFEESTQCARLLWEADEEVVFAFFMNERAFNHFGIAGYIVIST